MEERHAEMAGVGIDGDNKWIRLLELASKLSNEHQSIKINIGPLYMEAIYSNIIKSNVFAMTYKRFEEVD